MNITKAYPIYLIAIVYSIYELQGVLYPTGSIISQVSLFVYLAIGIYTLFMTFYKNRRVPPKVVIIWALFYLMNVICFVLSPKVVNGILYEQIGTVSTLGQFKNISAFLLTFLSIYYYTVKCRITNKTIFVIGIAFFLLSVVRFYYDRDAKMDLLGEDMIVNNTAYLLVATIPFIPFFFDRNKFLSFIILAITVTLVVQGTKRGAIVCMFASTLVFIIYSLKDAKLSFFNKLLIMVMVVAAGYFFMDSFTSNELLQARLYKTQHEGVGVREYAYVYLWDYWLNRSSTLSMVFGHGSAQTVTAWGNYAHNDWLELLINNGIVGVVLYALLFVSIIKYALGMKDDRYKLSTLLCVTIWFCQTIYSMGFTDLSGVFYTFLLGILIGNSSKEVISRSKKLRIPNAIVLKK